MMLDSNEDEGLSMLRHKAANKINYLSHKSKKKKINMN